jgi:phage/plasmid-like protein (TIGR03299 family)
MAHEIETMFYMNETPWHRLGTRVIDVPTADEAIVAAGLNWKVETKPLFLADGTQVPNKAVVRDTDNSVLGVVGENYQPLQNVDAFNFFNPFVETGLATFETAGSLRQGKRVWILCKINKDPMTIVSKSNDIVEKYVLLAHGHDGLMSVRVGFTPIRVVCANTLAMSINDSGSSLLRVKHTKNLQENLAEVSKIMNLANQKFEATAEQYRFLASREINAKDLEKFVKLVFVGPKYEQMEKEGQKPGRDILPKVIQLFETGRGNAMPGVSGTLWAAYNAANEFLGYERGADESARLDKMWFGDSANLNKRALEVALEMAAA